MVEAKEVNQVMSVGELAVRLEKRWVTPDSLVQQISCLQQFRSRSTAKACQEEIVGTCVEVESGDVTRRGTLDCTLFTRREFRLKLVGNRGCDLTLNREHIRKVAVISLPPYLCVGARIDQLRVDAHAITRALNASFHRIRDP